MGLDEPTGQRPGCLDRDLLTQDREDSGFEGVEAAGHTCARDEWSERGVIHACECASHGIGLAVEIEQIFDPVQHHR